LEKVLEQSLVEQVVEPLVESVEHNEIKKVEIEDKLEEIVGLVWIKSVNSHSQETKKKDSC